MTQPTAECSQLVVAVLKFRSAPRALDLAGPHISTLQQGPRSKRLTCGSVPSGTSMT
eukprot:CAMPEP_0204153278 /NCGR_PEP_ID=MMETSP0361-20130328/27727_1 /ASSEMBLY_ACC=CAM_ASM_000343 /TAXON_ID=268821 /ORGANISM="Scrippsiella Hangoei, Strain SHTV-5" /LENGTH=56 /DNA_ID=CAMNT_0051108379 /DNA_START=38 /DNA_END=204 /DNA_ORIENTATION=-